MKVVRNVQRKECEKLGHRCVKSILLSSLIEVLSVSMIVLL